MATTQTDTIDIAVTPETLYRFVTQPWRWHEWHPSSVGAEAAVDELAVGDTFDEVIELRPFPPGRSAHGARSRRARTT